VLRACCGTGARAPPCAVATDDTRRPSRARRSLTAHTRDEADTRSGEQRSDVRLSDFVVETVCTLIGLLEQAIYLSRYASLTISREISCHVSASLLQPLGRSVGGLLGSFGARNVEARVLPPSSYSHTHTTRDGLLAQLYSYSVVSEPPKNAKKPRIPSCSGTAIYTNHSVV